LVLFCDREPSVETLGYSQGKDATQILQLAPWFIRGRKDDATAKKLRDSPLQNGLGMLLVPGYG